MSYLKNKISILEPFKHPSCSSFRQYIIHVKRGNPLDSDRLFGYSQGKGQL